jgi:hypothetical protein
MVPRAVQDAGYTAVGLGVLALQQVQIRRRDLARRLNSELDAAGRQAHAVLGEVKAMAAPVTGIIETLPRLPGPVGQLIDGGRDRLVELLRPGRN